MHLFAWRVRLICNKTHEIDGHYTVQLPATPDVDLVQRTVARYLARLNFFPSAIPAPVWIKKHKLSVAFSERTRTVCIFFDDRLCNAHTLAYRSRPLILYIRPHNLPRPSVLKGASLLVFGAVALAYTRHRKALHRQYQEEKESKAGEPAPRKEREQEREQEQEQESKKSIAEPAEETATTTTTTTTTAAKKEQESEIVVERTPEEPAHRKEKESQAAEETARRREEQSEIEAGQIPEPTAELERKSESKSTSEPEPEHKKEEEKYQVLEATARRKKEEIERSSRIQAILTEMRHAQYTEGERTTGYVQHTYTQAQEKQEEQEEQQEEHKPMTETQKHDTRTTTHEITLKEFNLAPEARIEQQLANYPLTKRGVTSMAAFGAKPFEHKSSDGVFYLPVLRYDKLYYSSSVQWTRIKRVFCGKFFFYEPNSNVFMRLSNARFYATKIAAFRDLFGRQETRPCPGSPLSTLDLGHMQFTHNRFPNAQMVQLLSSVLDMHVFTDYQPERYAIRPLTRTGLTLLWDSMLMRNFVSIFPSQSDVPKSHGPLPVLYPSVRTRSLGIYKDKGDQDWMDQPLCQMAQHQGIDILVFQHEIGGNHANTEILCTSESWRDLLFTSDNVFTTLQGKQTPTYPTIWFPADNGVVVTRPEGPTFVAVALKNIFPDSPLEQPVVTQLQYVSAPASGLLDVPRAPIAFVGNAAQALDRIRSWFEDLEDEKSRSEDTFALEFMQLLGVPETTLQSTVQLEWAGKKFEATETETALTTFFTKKPNVFWQLCTPDEAFARMRAIFGDKQRCPFATWIWNIPFLLFTELMPRCQMFYEYNQADGKRRNLAKCVLLQRDTTTNIESAEFFDWKQPFYDTYYDRHKELAPNILVYTPTFFTRDNKERIPSKALLHVLHAAGYMFDTVERRDFKALKNRHEEVRQRYLTLFRLMFAATETLGFRTVLVSRVGTGHLADKWPGGSEAFQSAIWEPMFAQARKEQKIPIVVHVLEKDTRSLKQVLEIIEKQSLELDKVLLVNSWNSLDLPGNACNADTLDGDLGRTTCVSALGTLMTNPFLCGGTNVVALRL